MARKRLEPLVTGLLTSPGLRRLRRAVRAAPRVLTGARARVEYFHQPDDPYSHLAAQTLFALARGFNVDIRPHLVAPPGADAAPDAERLEAYARRDAGLLARAVRLDFPVPCAPPPRALLDRHRQVLAAALSCDRFGEIAPIAGAAYWRADASSLEAAAAMCGAERPDAVPQMEAGNRLRAKLGHYLGATFHFEGEWYWGVDRLHFLAERLASLGLATGDGRSELAGALIESDEARQTPSEKRPRLDFFASLRSPYTYLAAARARRLAERWDADLDIRFVLPMVMRGLPVPTAKRLYIVLDAKREAERLGLPFGRICDPVGAGAERGLAVLAHAIRLGRGPQFLESFLAGVFAEGVDAASERGLALLASRAGLGTDQVRAALADPAWRATAEANRRELLDLGLWGVPSFRVGNCPAHWGQDRLWAVEEDLRNAR